MMRLLAVLAVIAVASSARGETKDISYRELYKIVRNSPYGTKIKAFIGVPVHASSVEGIDYVLSMDDDYIDYGVEDIKSGLWICENTRDGLTMVRTNRPAVVQPTIVVAPLSATIKPTCVNGQCYRR